MRIWLDWIGPCNEQGSHYRASARVRVHTDQEAQLKGQEFARLCEHVTEGAMAYQRVIYGAAEEPET